MLLSVPTVSFSQTFHIQSSAFQNKHVALLKKTSNPYAARNNTLLIDG